MNKYSILLVVLISFPAFGQHQREEVHQVIIRIFDGMKDGDSARVSDELMHDVTMYSIFENNEGEPVLETGSAREWLASIASPHEQSYNEEIWDPVIHIDGDMAHVWVNYAFYVGDTYSHCGVDAFQLFYDGAAWRVFHVADTRRKDCDIPSYISKKHQRP